MTSTASMKMAASELKGKKITVMGLGVHGGVGNVRWLHRQGARLTVTDLRKEQELKDQVEEIKLMKGVKLVLGEHRAEDFKAADIVIRNPAVRRDSEFLQMAKQFGAKVEMDSSLLFRYVGRENIIGVTGSKGKTTAATAIAATLGIAQTGTEGGSPLEKISAHEKNKQIVFELSSWRLEILGEKKISPAVAVITSIYRDHLNTYTSFDEYKGVKKAIIDYQTKEDLVILNMDDAELVSWSRQAKGRVFGYSLEDLGYNGIFLRAGRVVVRLGGEERDVMPEQEIPLKHPQGKRNVLPAILLAVTQGINEEEIIRRIKNIQPLAHRMEEIVIHRGVKFINDSAATMPDATIAALEALAENNIVHILGGNDKNLDWSGWAKREAGAKIKGLVWLPGDGTEKMKESYYREGGRVQAKDAESMRQAVKIAAEMAEPDDIVLLSPGATSFELFKNEFDRGEQFRKAVEELWMKSDSSLPTSE